MRSATMTMDFARAVGDLDMTRVGLGQGGLSSDTIWESRIPEIRALKPGLIRFWIQEYFNILPAPGVYNFAGIDRSIDLILRAGATPLVSIGCKPKTLFPAIDEKNLTPTSWEQWDELIYRLVKRYVDQGHAGWYWEIGGEIQAGEGGGAPYLGTVETYIPYYEHTARAVLRADPAARVGGGGFHLLRHDFIPRWLDWGLTAPVPIHFLSWHGYENDPQVFRKLFGIIQGYLADRPGVRCETILDEWNVSLQTLHGHNADPRFQPCFIPEMAYQMFDMGLDYSCYYQIRDYHVDEKEFAPFFTPKGAMFMARWWNRMPQRHGLFDYQNTVRPAYFSFKLLSRLTGRRLHLESTDDLIHGFLVHEPHYRLTNLMFWNFSDQPAQLTLQLKNLPEEQESLRLILDAASASNDENERLRPTLRETLAPGDHAIDLPLDPFAVHFWCLHGKSWDIGA